MPADADADALVARFCPPLDPSLVLAIAREPDRDGTESEQILNELAQATPVETEVVSPERPAPSGEQDAVLAFLSQSFPSKSLEELRTALNQAHDDVDAAMDALLAEQMLASSSPTQSKSPGLDLDALSLGLAPKKGKKNKTASTKPVKVSLTDQRSAHHIYAEKRRAPPPSTRAAMPAFVPDADVDDAELARRLQNAERDAVAGNEVLVGHQQWLLASSTLSQLASLLALPTEKVQSLFNQSSFNLHVAFARAIEYAASMPAAHDAQAAPEFATVCDTLAAITGKDVRRIRTVLLATRGEQSAALDLLQLQDVVTQAADGANNRPDVLDPTAKLPSDAPSAALYTPTVSHKRTVAPGPPPRWLDTGDTSYAGRTAQTGATARTGQALAAHTLSEGRGAIVLPASSDRVELSTEQALDLDGTFSSEECRQRATELREKRNEALRQAARSARRYRGSAAGGLSGAATVYAEEARKYDAAARRWQLRAATALVDQRRTDTTGLSSGHVDRIDLHGLTVHEALTVVSHTVQRATSRAHGETPRTFLEIVTGRGTHSRHNVSVIRPAVARLLAQRGYTVDTTSDPGILYVKHAR